MRLVTRELADMRRNCLFLGLRSADTPVQRVRNVTSTLVTPLLALAGDALPVEILRF